MRKGLRRGLVLKYQFFLFRDLTFLPAFARKTSSSIPNRRLASFLPAKPSTARASNALVPFECVGSPWRHGQISLRDIRMLFEYYLRNARSHDWLRKFGKVRIRVT